MPSLTTGVPYFEHPSIEGLRHVNWEAIRVFLVVERTSSLRAAASALGMATNTVRRHLDILEREMGTTLIKRGYEGVELTQEGKEFSEAVRPMEAAAFNGRRIARKGYAPLVGPVRISVTEGIGTFWVMPRLVDFQRAHPRLVVELNCTMRPPALERLEADVAIQITRPEDLETKAVKVGRMHAMFFASREYFATYGQPKTIADLANHKVVEQVSPQVQYSEYDRLFPGRDRSGFVSVMTNTSSAHYWAVAKGAGLGMLPTYLWAIGARVEPSSLDYHTSYDVFVVYHPGSRRSRKIATTIDWLRKLFDPNEFPWFRDEFIPPDRLVDAVKKSRVRDAFSVFGGSSSI